MEQRLVLILIVAAVVCILLAGVAKVVGKSGKRRRKMTDFYRSESGSGIRKHLENRTYAAGNDDFHTQILTETDDCRTQVLYEDDDEMRTIKLEDDEFRTERLPYSGQKQVTVTLTQTDHPTVKYEFSIRGMITIGRGSDCGARVSGSSISRRHASLTVDEGDIYVENVSENNTVLVNGETVRGRFRLMDGAVLTLGAVSFYVGIR